MEWPVSVSLEGDPWLKGVTRQRECLSFYNGQTPLKWSPVFPIAIENPAPDSPVSMASLYGAKCILHHL